MIKSFHEILAEKDEDFTYYVKSTVDIHQPEYFERVKHALLPWRIKEIRPDGHTPISRDNRTFPHWPNTATYTVKVVTGLPVDTKKTLELVAMVCHIHISHLKMVPDDDVESELVGKPIEVDSGTSQSLVGTKRIGEFMRELKKDRAEREQKAVTREVYESFYTTHRALENVLKKPIRKGYYVVEMGRQDDSLYLRAEGPYKDRTDEEAYRDTIEVGSAEIVSEDDSTDHYGVHALIEIRKPKIGVRMFEVRVADMNSGRRFTTTVHAATPEIARQNAVQQVAEANRLDPADLTAMAPKEAGDQMAEARRGPAGGSGIFNVSAMSPQEKNGIGQAMRPMIQRKEQAYQNFVNQIVERGFDQQTAQAMVQTMLKEKLMKYDGMRYVVKHGGFMDPEVLQRIAHYATTGQLPQAAPQ